MKLIPKPLRRWLLIGALIAVPLQVHPQAIDPAETTDETVVTETEETDRATEERAEKESETANVSEAIREAVSEEITEAVDEAAAADGDRDSRRVPSRRQRAEPFVGILNDIVVEEGEIADVVVAILANYEIRGESAHDAVAILGEGNVSGFVDGNCVTVLGKVEINEPIDGNVVIVCSEAYINAPIDGDCILVLSNVEFGPNAKVGRQTVIVGPQPKTDARAVFDGPKRKIHLPDFSWLGEYVRTGPLLGRPIAPGIAWVWYLVLFFFVFRLLLLLLFPRPINAGVKVMQQGSLRTFLIGVIAYILYLPALALLSATVVGGIAVPFVALAWEVATILGKISVLVLLGNHLGRQLKISTMETPLGGFFVGTLLITLIYMVPVLGMLVHFLIKPLALGCMLVAAIDAFQRERKPPTIPPSPNTSSAGSKLHTNPAPANPTAPPSPETGTGAPPIIGSARSSQPSPDELNTFQRVGFWPRFGASILDFILIMITCVVLVDTEEFFPFIWIGYHIGMWAWRGTTLGGIVFSLRIVRLDGRPFDITTAIVRFMGGALSLVIAGLGFFWASWNPEKQSWHDMIAGTIIVKTPRSTPLV